MSKRRQAVKIFLVIAFFVLIWTVLFSLFDAEKVISIIGIKNGYLIAFTVALIGGVSAFTAASFYATVAFLASAGYSPILLALVSVPALIAGDYLFYILGKQGKISSSGDVRSFIEKMSSWFNRRPRKYFPLFIYIYSGFTAFPADALMLTLAFLGYPFKKALPFIILGHITFITLVSVGAFAIFG